jgi:hypothetical protein
VLLNLQWPREVPSVDHNPNETTHGGSGFWTRGSHFTIPLIPINNPTRANPSELL